MRKNIHSEFAKRVAHSSLVYTVWTVVEELVNCNFSMMHTDSAKWLYVRTGYYVAIQQLTDTTDMADIIADSLTNKT